MYDLITLDDGTERARWLAARVPVITATQAAAIAGSHPYASMRDVWDEKTDPDYDRDADRNPWLMERAELGVQRERAIIHWMSERTAIDFQPSTALVSRGGIEHRAATPDAWGKVPARGWKPSQEVLDLLASEGLGIADLKGRQVLLEAKTTQTRWDVKGLPQHIIDQALWQLYVTGYAAVLVGAEFYAWKGRGDRRTAEEVGTGMFLVTPSAYKGRMDFLLREVAKFEHLLAEGIAPETDLDVTQPPLPEWDDDEETAADKAALAADLEAARKHLARIAELEEELAQMDAKADELKAEREAMRAILKPYAGRRISIHGERFTATLSRYNQADVNTKALPPATLRSITTWTEKERLTFQANTTEETA